MIQTLTMSQILMDQRTFVLTPVANLINILWL